MFLRFIFAVSFRRIAAAWADLPLRTKGPVVVAIPVAALLAASLGFGLSLDADHKSDVCLQQITVLIGAVQDCLNRLDSGPCAPAFGGGNTILNATFLTLEKLLPDDPDQRQRLRRIEQDCRSDHWRYSASQAFALRAALRRLRDEQERRLLARAAGMRRRALAAIAADALVGISGGFLAVLLFVSAVTRVSRLQRNAARLEQRLPLLPWPGGRDELGSLHLALEKSSASLRRSEEERDHFFTLSLHLLCTTTLDGVFRRVNPAFTATLGFPESALLGSNLLDFVHPGDRAAAACQLRQLAQGTPVDGLEHRFRCADGAYKWLLWSLAPSLSEGLAYGIARDRTQCVQDEQALRESHARMVAVLESTTDAFFAVDREWRITYVNARAETLWNRTRQQILGRNLWEVFPEAVGGLFYDFYQEVMSSGKANHIEDFYSPWERWFEVHAYPAAEGLYVYFRDITARRQAEARMIDALKNNEVLLREVHHRVKNNLQVICSMLRLQAGYIQDGALLQVLRDCRERVYAMALLHDQLHRARDLASIDLGEYIKNVASSLFCSYGVDSGRIGLLLDLENINVAFDTAIPCGLIVHELVSNALRHAFLETGAGRVSLGLRRDNGSIELSVADDGIGFPESAGDTQSLGLRLVKLLAEQMEAVVERSSLAGTRYGFRFQIKNPMENDSNEQSENSAG